ncbi:hypothetical protein D3C80_1667500 [compost metagenome]
MGRGGSVSQARRFNHVEDGIQAPGQADRQGHPHRQYHHQHIERRGGNADSSLDVGLLGGGHLSRCIVDRKIGLGFVGVLKDVVGNPGHVNH